MQGIYYLAAQSTYVDPYDDVLSRFVGGGLPTALLGIITVFLALSLIWGCLELFKLIFYTIPEKRKGNSKENTEETVKELPETEVVPVNNDGEIVAAIIAAITAFRAEESAETEVTPKAFRVVSFRRK